VRADEARTTRDERPHGQLATAGRISSAGRTRTPAVEKLK
jgi:hypothetical protein